MVEAELSRAIKSGGLEGAFFFYGDEDYLKNIRVSEVKALLSEDERAFNLFDLFYGEGECDLEEIEKALSAPPFMSERKVIIISFSSLDSIKDKIRERLIELVSENSGMSGQILIIKAGENFRWGSERQPSGFLKAISKVCEPIRFDYQTEQRLAGWLMKHCGAWGVKLSQESAIMMIRLCGRGMYKLSGEAAKVSAYVGSCGRGEVTAEDIRLCCSTTDEDEAFVLVNAIAEGNAALAYHCLGIKKRLRADPYMLMGQIEREACDLASAAVYAAEGYGAAEFARDMKINSYRAGIIYRNAKAGGLEYYVRLADYCRRADVSMKTTSTSRGYGEIEKLIGLMAR